MDRILVDAFNYYDENEIDEKLGGVNKITFENGMNSYDHPKIIMSLGDKNTETIESRYEVLGVYDKRDKIWIWAWALPQMEKQKTIIVRQLFNYAFTLKEDQLDLKRNLITSTFKISNYIQLESQIAMAAYLTKKPHIYEYKMNSATLKKKNSEKIVENVLEYKTNDEVSFYIILLDKI